MKKQTGIWLDKEKAIIINLSKGKHTIKYIESNITIRERIPGEGKKFGRFGSQFLSLENKKKNRIKKQSAKYLKKIVLEIKNSDEIVLFGPAEMKIDLEKMILENNKISSKLVAVKTADSMTENQLVAWVKEYYN
jgi:stalled ribosome rescue protein Dom34